MNHIGDEPLEDEKQESAETEIGKVDGADEAAPDTPEATPPTPLKKMLAAYYDLLDSVAFATICTMLIFIFVGRTAVIDGSSMYPTLQDGERVVLVSALYSPQQGDMIVATRKDSPYEPVAKRIIALEGQTVFIDFTEGAVYVDGELLDEPYVNSPTNLSEGVEFPVVVPEGKVFVLGDNRNNSLDSRSPRIGFVDRRNIVGEIRYAMSPFKKIKN